MSNKYVEAALAAANAAASSAAGEGASAEATTPEPAAPAEPAGEPADPAMDPDEAKALAEDKAAGVAAPAPPPPEPPKQELEGKLSKNFDALIAKERALRQEQQALKEKENQYRQFERMKEAMDAKDPIALLQAAGMSWQAAVDRVVKGEAGAPAQELPPGIKELMEKVSSLENSLKQEKAQAAAHANRQAVLSKAQSLVDKDTERFSLVKERGAVPEALQLLEQYFDANGSLPGADMDESLLMALDHLEQKYTSEMERWLTTSKAKSKLGSIQGKPGKEAAPVQATSGQAKTLTSSHVPAPAGSGAPRVPKTAEDYQRAALEAYGALTKG